MKTLILEKDKVKTNVSVVRDIVGFAKIIAVVKGNGYGFGICQYTRFLQELGLDFFAVATIEEAKALRECGITAKILLLSPTEMSSVAEDIVDLDLVATIGSTESAIVLNNAAADKGKNVFAHIAIDSGFGRFGFLPGDEAKIKTIVDSLTNVTIDGIFSHLSASFIKKKKLTLKQQYIFAAMVGALENLGLTFTYKHLANSCAIFLYPSTIYNTVRIGSAFIGRLPIKKKTELLPCGYLEVEVDNLRYLPPKHNIGYANTFKTKRTTRIAIISFGYGDGLATCKAHDTFRIVDKLRYVYKELLTFFTRNGIYCTINGKRTKVLGRVGLSNCVVDVSNVPCSVGDIAIFKVNPLYIDGNVTREMR